MIENDIKTVCRSLKKNVPFMGAGNPAICIVSLAVSFHAIQVENAIPLKSLRTE